MTEHDATMKKKSQGDVVDLLISASISLHLSDLPAINVEPRVAPLQTPERVIASAFATVSPL